MDILPKKFSQFQDEDYWKQFFQDTRTNQGFEWYAQYKEIEYLLKPVLK